ncbi:MAG TPA: 30S ribosome-binding factor RbfA [Patescibacteria group bacterium]|nr:30S ribosome-binding factor RbfA [Patescibacteria group bacterium]
MRKVNAQIHRLVSEIIAREIELPLDVFVTVTKVETDRDLRNAKILVTVLPDNRRVSTIHQIERCRGLIQKILGSRLQIKFTPHLHFQFDESQIKAHHLYDVIDRLKHKDENEKK